MENLDREIAQQRARIREAQANVRATEAQVRQYQSNPARQAGLVQNGALSRQSFEHAQADLDHALGLRDAALSQVELASRSLAVLEGQRGLRTAELEAATAALEAATRDLSYARIVAPFDGVLGKRHVQIGSLVGTGTQIVSIVPSTQAYVIANYKETQLARVRPGQPATLTVDGLPGRRLRARVDRIAPMSGGESALLPADNASGNFTKVVQRIPVRLELLPGQEDLARLRPGMSAEVSIDTQGDTAPAHAISTPGSAPLALALTTTGGGSLR